MGKIQETKWYQSATQRIDKLLNQFVSKKLTVFVIATTFVYLGKITPGNWVDIAMVYIVAQGVVDIAKSIVSKKQ